MIWWRGMCSSGGSGGAVRTYAITDANFDMTGITNTSGGVLERFGYTPFGTRTVMNNSYGSDQRQLQLRSRLPGWAY